MLSTLHHLIACHSWIPTLSACMPIKVNCWKYSRFNIRRMPKFKRASGETREDLKFKALPEEAWLRIPLVASVLCIVILRRVVCLCCTLTLSVTCLCHCMSHKRKHKAQSILWYTVHQIEGTLSQIMLTTTTAHTEVHSIWVLPLIMCKLKRCPGLPTKLCGR